MATLRDKNERDFRIASSSENASLNFNKIMIDGKTLRDDVIAIIDGYNKKFHGLRKFKKFDVVRALEGYDLRALREISRHFYRTNGIYRNLILYMAHLYRYDWFVTPICYDETIKPMKIVEGWYKSCMYLENCNLKFNFGRIATTVLRDGAYYGYKIEQRSATYLQPLPTDYCRSRYEWNGKPVVEFNISFFDEAFPDSNYRIRVLKMFPKEFQKAYLSYKKGTLVQDFNGDSKGWFLLDPMKAVKFNLNGDDAPLFIGVIPALLDLEEAQDIDRDKMKQQLLRLIIQKLPIDKNGDLVFDVDEAQAFHANAVNMTNGAIGTKVLTTFADVSVADLSDKGNVSSVDQLEKIERTVYNTSGVSQMQFNTEKNAAMVYSTANNVAIMTDLVLQFEKYAQELLAPYNKNPKRLHFVIEILPTTVHNYVKMSETYKSQTTIGFSKLLPQVALGRTQSSIIATAIIENEILNLDEIFVAPQMSSTRSSSDKETTSSNSGTTLPSDNKGGRPEKAEEEKSEKTIQNRESSGEA